MKDNTELHRQIHPSFVVNNQVSIQAFTEVTGLIVSSGAFNPTEKDENKLSVYNGIKFTAQKSFEHFCLEYKSFGVLTLIVEEVNSIESLSCNEDNYPFDGHSYIDFSQVSAKNQRIKKAGKLRDIAFKRGWTYKP